MKILITKCKICDCIISGKVVPDNFMPNGVWYKYELYGVNSKENKEGFKITGCKCKDEIHPSGLSNDEIILERLVDAIKAEPSTLACISFLKQF